MKKRSRKPINSNKYSCYGLKKILTRNLITKKIPAARKVPTPPPQKKNVSNSVPNSLALGDYAEKHVLKLVERFSGHCRAIKS